jgi:hypothetical protein
MVQSKAENGYRSRTRTNTRRVLWWNVAWVAATALMAFGPKFLWNRALGLTLLGVGINVATGVGMLLATKKYVMELDELQRKVYLNALAVTVGVTLIAGIPYSVLNLYHLVPFQADIAHLVMLMTMTFLVSFLYGTWRYR